jgi:hypothetical protein
MAQDEVDKFWSKVCNFIAMSLQRSLGEMTPLGVRNALKDGSMQMWLVADMGGADDPVKFVAGCVTQIVEYESFRSLRIAMIGGAGLDEWKDKLMSAVDHFARSEGCKYIEAVGRRGLEKKISPLGFKPEYTVYIKEVPGYGQNGRGNKASQ